MNIESLYSDFLSSGGVSTDSRKVMENQVFFALKGDNFDGNKYAGEALNRGCKLVVVDDPTVVTGNNCLHVDDSLQCLQQLALFHRKKLTIPVLAITGSNGKTTTKELISCVLSRKFKVMATRGNLNNHIGVPLSLLSIRDEELAIIEMGANHPGEIGFLCQIARPTHGIITNIGKAHLEGFGGFEGVKKTKSELYQFLDASGGTVFINGNNEILRELTRTGSYRKVFYMSGPQPVCDGYIIENREFLRVAVRFQQENELLEAELGITGAYNLENILAAACIGSSFGISPVDIMTGLSGYESKNNRSQFIDTGKNRVVLDAYNANPTSMDEALKNFRTTGYGKKVLILGDMLEMGEYAYTEHENLLRSLDEDKFLKVFLVGREFFKFREQFNFNFFTSVEGLIEHFKENPVVNSLILVKGSRGIALEKVLELL
jgi:UDP-N-acetylmuramoyl-tripeptide--D-alanyl-D-alanine ligase